jgi:hypothetical protein
MHGHDLDAVGARVVVARALAHLVRQLALPERDGAGLHDGMAAAQDGHVGPGRALFVRGGQQLHHADRLVAQRGQADDLRRGAFAASAHGLQLRDAVVVGHAFAAAQQTRGHPPCQLEHLARIAVVDLQHRGAAAGPGCRRCGS